jgi:O-antigen ligase
MLGLKKYSIWTSPEIWNIQKIFQVIIFLGTAVILSLLVIGSSSFQIIFVPAGVFFLYIFVKKPEIGILVIIAIIASIIFESALPLLPIPGGRIHITDIILLALLLRIPFKALTDKSFRFVATPLDIPFLLFIFAAFISAGISIFKYGIDYRRIIASPLRILMYYLLFFVITNLIREKKQIRFLLGGLFGIAIVISLAMIIQAKLGESIHMMPGRVETADQTFQTTRIIPPGEVVIFVSFISAICAIAIVKKPLLKTIYFYYIPILGGGVILTFNRQYWASIIFSLFIFMLLISKRGKRRFISWLTLVFVSVILVILPLMRLSKTARTYSDSIVERFSSIFAVKETFSSSSLEWRKIENKYAWQSIVKHPFFGIGLWNYYRPYVGEYETDWTKIFIHNGYFFVLVNMGLIGFLPLMWFYVSFLARGFSNWRKINHPIEKSVVIGYTIGGIALSLSILVEPRVMENHGIVVIATIIGLSEAIIRRNEKESIESVQ